jgi:molybdate transport system substrate-binding protein
MRLAWLFSFALSVPAMAEDITVFAAASLAGPLDEIAEAFEGETGDAVTLVYAASSALARQVEAGAPADVVILANEAWMAHLAEVGAVSEARRTLLTNRLVLIGSWHLTDPLALDDLPEALGHRRLSLALTEAVPAGIYARQALENAGQWEALSAQVVEADNVRAAQMLVAIGAAGYGVVYATDVAEERRVTVLAEIDAALHDPIRYPVALTVGASEAAAAFYDYLSGPVARATFSGAGFGLPEE